MIPEITAGDLSPSDILPLVGLHAPIILDIGANDGLDTLRFIEHIPNAHVYSFEPDPRAFDELKYSAEGKAKGTFQMALSDYDGIGQFYQSCGTHPDPDVAALMLGGWDQSGSLNKPDKAKAMYPWLDFKKTPLDVKVQRLDTWCQKQKLNHQPIDFIWADVQGGELNLLKGGVETLKRTRYLYLEYSNNQEYENQPTLEQLCNFLTDFQIHTLYSDDVLFRNTHL